MTTYIVYSKAEINGDGVWNKSTFDDKTLAKLFVDALFVMSESTVAVFAESDDAKGMVPVPLTSWKV